MVFSSRDKPPPYDLSNFTILVVEDSAYMHSLISSMLKVFNVGDIMVCEGGREAIDLLKVTQARTKSSYINSVDIVLTDWLMNKGAGEELLRWIRSSDRDEIRFLPVIVCSGYTTDTITSKARDLGAHEILVKPVSGSKLASRICSVIDKPRPFLKTPHYFGPDRRRKELPYKGKERRLIQTQMIKVEDVETLW
ncbi:MAG: response regulator [Rhodospirillales bacterium]|nr:response regulator [Rhodospirillales bacterium]